MTVVFLIWQGPLGNKTENFREETGRFSKTLQKENGATKTLFSLFSSAFFCPGMVLVKRLVVRPVTLTKIEANQIKLEMMDICHSVN